MKLGDFISGMRKLNGQPLFVFSLVPEGIDGQH